MTTTATALDIGGPGAASASPRRVRRAAVQIGNFGLAALVILLTLFIATMLVASVTKHHVEQVTTGSMVPAIPVGSMVLIERVGVTALHVGDILVFPKPTNTSEVIVHRIVAVANASNGSIQVRTKGDANTAQDPWVIQQGAHGAADRAVYIVPSLGTALLVGRNVLLILLPALLLVWLGAWSRRRYLTIVRGGP